MNIISRCRGALKTLLKGKARDKLTLRDVIEANAQAENDLLLFDIQREKGR